MFGIADDSVFSDVENNELQSPCPRKELDGRTIYTSRELKMPQNVGAPILCDFGSAVMGDEEHSEDIQPDAYRAPEVILRAPWSYSVDIWNVGCVVRKVDTSDANVSGLTLSDLEPFRRGVAVQRPRPSVPDLQESGPSCRNDTPTRSAIVKLPCSGKSDCFCYSR